MAGLTDKELAEQLLIAAVRGGRSYEWSNKMAPLLTGLSLDNYEEKLNAISRMEAQATVEYVRELVRRFRII